MISISVTGNLGRDAELKHFDKGSVCEFGVASTVKVKGEKRTTWVRAKVYGKRGEALCQYLNKGVKVWVVGEGELREYTKRDGSAGSSLEVNVGQIDLLGGRSRDSDQGEPQPSQHGQQKQDGDQPSDGYEEDTGDLPF